MSKSNIISETGKLWHYHMIGFGLIYTYNSSERMVKCTCVHSSQEISSFPYKFEDKEDFKETMDNLMLMNIEDSMPSMDLDYFEQCEIVGCIGVDFDLIKN